MTWLIQVASEVGKDCSELCKMKQARKWGWRASKIFLSEQDAYALHKPARTHFARNTVFVSRPLNQFQADLCNMQALAEHNDGFKYLLMVIDIFSKKAYMHVLKNKTTAEVVRASESIFKESDTGKATNRCR